jgi:hypothetical protein
MLAEAVAGRGGAGIENGAGMLTEGTGAAAERGAAQQLPAVKNCNTLSMYRDRSRERDRSRDRYAVTSLHGGKV